MGKRRNWTVLALTLVAASVFAASAFAGGNGTLCKVYCKHGTGVQKQLDGGSPFTPPTSDGSGTLPFTGLDLGFIALAGALFVLAGFGLQRATRERPEPPTG